MRARTKRKSDDFEPGKERGDGSMLVVARANYVPKKGGNCRCR